MISYYLIQASLRKMLKQLEREKASMEGQLRDYEWRLDQESKVCLILLVFFFIVCILWNEGI